VGHGGWAGRTAVGYSGLACRCSARRFVASRRGPRRLTSEPVGAHGQHLNRHGHGEWMSKVQNFQTFVYFCKMILKNVKKFKREIQRNKRDRGLLLNRVSPDHDSFLVWIFFTFAPSILQKYMVRFFFKTMHLALWGTAAGT
jgi:hypothetical protein